MSDYNDYRKLTYEELEHQNKDLREINKNLRQQLNLDSYTARVYAPNKSYKELETKLAQAEELRKKDIDELWETRITPLQNQVKDRELKMESMYKQQVSYTEEIVHLKKIIDRLNTIVNYAAGYISACKQFSNKHPNYVKDWLFQGVEGYQK